MGEYTSVIVMVAVAAHGAFMFSHAETVLGTILAAFIFTSAFVSILGTVYLLTV